jgi:hypothetical protein
MVEKLPLQRAVWDAYERVLNKGIAVSAADRMSIIAIERDTAHGVVVTSAETYSETRSLQ